MSFLDGLLSRLTTGSFAAVSTVVFFSAFVAIAIWTWTRPRKEIERQSRLWEDDED